MTLAVSGSGPNLIVSRGRGNGGAGELLPNVGSVTACQRANVYDGRSYHPMLLRS